MIFSNQFPKLKHVSIPCGNDRYTDGIKIWSINLTYLCIACCNKSLLYSLLDHLSNLSFFQFELGTSKGRPMKNQCLPLKQLHMMTYDRQMPQHTSMMDFDEMINLYRCLPNLEGTSIIMYYSGTTGYALRHSNDTLSQCKKLKSYCCFIRYTTESPPQTYLDEIKKSRILYFKIASLVPGMKNRAILNVE
ncbi:unnamed protein product [Rotaria magnacalcarata]|uniref:Uncharacterized protein n=1 Tax=Rotaria magnacalcarata TaxID=392030 RepID=A0A816WFJ2_9BILA|nr:unnamed protein product [Rotaria magnacalcarata]CAF5198321.1 unnamed protein product [Rotaria magnacalcarata]